MKLKNIYSLMAGTLLLLAACSPDDYSFGDKQYSKEDLSYPNGFDISYNGNKVGLHSKLTGATSNWITPQGRSQQSDLTLALPFAGKYQVTLGAETRGGEVWGDPYTFSLESNDFSLLSDPKYFYLADSAYTEGEDIPDAATLTKGVCKRWYPCDQDYGLGCTAPMMYMTPYDPTNTGDYTQAEADALVYKDVPFGRANWAPNWDPGYQSWLLPNTNKDCYLASYMEFKMDAANGCTATMFRGESGDSENAKGTDFKNGKFQLELTDPSHPTISFTDCYAMHNIGFDDVCSNWTQNIIIADLTPYYLCLVTKRTNSEGNWYLVWNFVSDSVRATKGACIPSSEVSYLTTTKPLLTDFDNIATDMFTVENNGNNYVGNVVTYTVDAEAPYDFYWWNSAENAGAWQSLLTNSNGEVQYNSSWAPQPDDSYSDVELVLEKRSDGLYYYTQGDKEGNFTFDKNTITFDQDVTFVTSADGSKRDIAVTGKTFTIIKETAAEGMTIGIPNSKDASGNVNSYLCVNLKTKALGGGTTGPTVIDLTNDYTADGCSGLEQNKYYRLIFYNTWNDGKGLCKDITKVKLKKNQKLTIKFTLKDPSAWTGSPKCVICENCINSTWEPDAYDLSEATLVNLAGETTVTLTNTTGSTQTFTAGSLQLSIQLDGYYKDFDGSTTPDIIQSVTASYE